MTYIEPKHTDRYFRCTESFVSEGRKCLAGLVYTAETYEDHVMLFFENGDMNFTLELFERVVKAWYPALIEITKGVRQD